MICAVLVTASLSGRARAVALNEQPFRIRSPQRDRGEHRPEHGRVHRRPRLTTQQRRMVEAMQTLPGVQAAGLIDIVPGFPFGGGHSVSGFSVPGHRICGPGMRPRSPGCSTAFLRAISPRRERGCWPADELFLARRCAGAARGGDQTNGLRKRFFGSVTGALGGSFKLLGWHARAGRRRDGGRKICRCWGKTPLPAMFFPILQGRSALPTFIVVRSNGGQRIASGGRGLGHGGSVKLDAGLPYDSTDVEPRPCTTRRSSRRASRRCRWASWA